MIDVTVTETGTEIGIANVVARARRATVGQDYLVATMRWTRTRRAATTGRENARTDTLEEKGAMTEVGTETGDHQDETLDSRMMIECCEEIEAETSWTIETGVVEEIVAGIMLGADLPERRREAPALRPRRKSQPPI